MHMKSIRVFKRHNRRELPDICSVARPGTATLRRFMLPICTLRQLMVLKAALIVCLSVLLRAWGQRLNDSICFQDASFYGYCHTGGGVVPLPPFPLVIARFLNIAGA